MHNGRSRKCSGNRMDASFLFPSAVRGHLLMVCILLPAWQRLDLGNHPKLSCLLLDGAFTWVLSVTTPLSSQRDFSYVEVFILCSPAVNGAQGKPKAVFYQWQHFRSLQQRSILRGPIDVQAGEIFSPKADRLSRATWQLTQC